MRNYFFPWFAAAICIAGSAFVSPAPATPGYTTNLMIQLDGTNLPADSSAISVWTDQKIDEDGDDTDNHQDFGQGTSGKRPVARDMLMPNGTTRRVAEFNRGTVTTTSATTSSDFLQGRTGSTATGAFGGADANFNFGGTAGDDGLTWFTVHRSRLTSTGVGNNTTPQNQGVLNIAHTTANVYWGTFYAADGASSTIDERTDLYQTTRDATPVVDGGPFQQNHGFGNVPETSSWFISATSWNLDTGVMETKFLQENQTLTELTMNGAVYTEPFSAHIFSTLGGRSTNTSTGQHLDGWIAETLVYKAALTETDMDSVISYLNQKYFVSPPGDHNGDGIVDAADYVTWRNDPTMHDNDQGYLDWRANFGTGSGAGASIGAGNAVPEPTAAMLLITAVLASVCCRRR